ncbi:MAG: hypothetical protein ACR2MP_31110 [Streptosporangiaceae bacterium]
MTRTGGGGMTPLEDRVREAIRATAAEVPPDAVPPLRLPARRQSSFSPAHGGRERAGGLAGRAWAVPLAAAAAVAAVLAVVFALAGVIHPGRAAHGGPAGLAALPRYYVALNYTGNGQCCTSEGKLFSPRTDVVVRATMTGHALATIDPPRPYGTFAGVTAAGDDRTFVLAAEKLARYPLQEPDLPETKFFILRLDPASHNPAQRARLTPLPIPAPQADRAGNQILDFALSPDGARLAVLSDGVLTTTVSVFDVATGAGRSWSQEGLTAAWPGANQNALSWGADNRTLAIFRVGVRLLDTAKPGSGLLADSRVAVGHLPGAAGVAGWTQARLTPDGTAVIANQYLTRKEFSQRLVEFSARTGKVIRVLGVATSRHSGNELRYGSYQQVHWMSPSGDVLIVTGAQRGVPSPAPFADVDAGVWADGHYTPLPWSENTFTAAW